MTCFGISPKYLSHAPLLSIITETARERDRSERDAICNMYRKIRNGSVSVVSSNKHKTKTFLRKLKVKISNTIKVRSLANAAVGLIFTLSDVDVKFC